MKIRLSLRLYFFVSMLLLSSIMAISFSLLSVNSYIDGLDKGLNGIMYSISQNTKVEKGKPQKIMEFYVANRWEDTPAIIQERFAPPTKTGLLQKDQDQSSIFTLPKSLYFVVYYLSPAGEARYISRIFLEKERPKRQTNFKPARRLAWIIATGLFGIALFAFFLFMVMKRIAKPIETLRSWAKSLNPKNLQLSPPDFTYNELNTLAKLIRSSLVAAHDSLEREKDFLSYASHELRTPISVIRSNVELLNRLSEKSPLNDKQNTTIARIQRAALTMSDLTNTLLWLSRSEEQKSEKVAVDLHGKISLLCKDLDYLLNGKQVSVILKNEDENTWINTEATACQIVLTNLIRNAFQHTQSGIVEITSQGSRVTIVNSNQYDDAAVDNKTPTEPATIGYGLGLQLSEKIIKRHGWSYEIKDTSGRYEVVVGFSEK